MAIIVNNPDTSTDTGIGMMVGIILGVVVAVTLVVYGLPMIRGTANQQQTTQPGVQINLPVGGGSTDSGNTN